MKKIIRNIVILSVLVCLPALINSVYADQPPDPGGGPGGGDPVGGGSSIGGGMLTMLILALGYGSRKIISSRKKLLE